MKHYLTITLAIALLWAMSGWAQAPGSTAPKAAPKAPVTSPPPSSGQAPAVNKAPATSPTPSSGQAPAVNKAPVTSPTPLSGQTPAVNKAPAETKAPADQKEKDKKEEKAAKTPPAPGNDEAPKNWGTKLHHGAVKLGYWSAGYTGNVKVEGKVQGAWLGEDLSLVDDLKLSNPENVFQIAVDWRMSRRNRWYVSYFQSQYQGENKKVVSYDFNGITLDGDISTDLGVSRIQTLYQFSPWTSDRGYIGFLLGTNIYLYDLKVESHTGNQKEDANFPVPIPVGGIAGEYTIGYGLGPFGEFSMISMDIGDLNFSGFEISDLSVSFYEVLAGVQFKYKRLYSSLGYQWLNSNVTVDTSDIKADLGLSQQGVILNLGVNL